MKKQNQKRSTKNPNCNKNATFQASHLDFTPELLKEMRRTVKEDQHAWITFVPPAQEAALSYKTHKRLKGTLI